MEKESSNRLLDFLNSAINALAIMNLIVLFVSPYLQKGVDPSLALIIYSGLNILSYLTISIADLLIKGFKDFKLPKLLPFAVIAFGIYLLFKSPEYFLIFITLKQFVILFKKFLLYAFEGQLWHFIINNPAISLMSSFLLVITVGAFLLMLPISTTTNQPMNFIDAIFTSTSATCVTGLIVEDTGSYFTHFGQIIIILLIQIGGLGLMTISTAFALIFGQRLTAKMESVMQDVMGESNRLNLFQLLKYVMGITILFEFVGAVFLFFTFKNLYSNVYKAIYYSIFHSVSAFCNAGFSLFSNNLEPFANNINVNLVVSFLIIFGGLGFVVIMDIKKNLFRKGGIKKLSLHSKVVIASTTLLIVFGLIGFFISEYNNTMDGLSFGKRFLASYFQSVTCRTAGFNTISQTNLSYSSILLSVILMFIGASPGSTGGGIKTTTFAIMVLSIGSILTGKKNVSAYKRKISMDSIKEAVGLIGISLGFLMLLLFALFVVTDGTFQEITFEAFSAFGTVGLSMGFTSSLNIAGKIIIILLMYLGRIGPLTILYALAQRVVKKRVNYLEENISIG
ncbi:MAG: TrkH family potassium uptake protein [Candidatus Cloacimonadales bacterium]